MKERLQGRIFCSSVVSGRITLEAELSYRPHRIIGSSCRNKGRPSDKGPEAAATGPETVSELHGEGWGWGSPAAACCLVSEAFKVCGTNTTGADGGPRAIREAASRNDMKEERIHMETLWPKCGRSPSETCPCGERWWVSPSGA